MEIGDNFEMKFSFSQKQVDDFALVTGDVNPIHLDEEVAAKSVFGQRVLHGFLSGSIFSKIFGNIWPGSGTIYLSQDMKFLEPMFPTVEYIAHCEVIQIVNKKVHIKCSIIDCQGIETLTGSAILLLNK